MTEGVMIGAAASLLAVNWIVLVVETVHPAPNLGYAPWVQWPTE